MPDPQIYWLYQQRNPLFIYCMAWELVREPAALIAYLDEHAEDMIRAALLAAQFASGSDKPLLN